MAKPVISKSLCLFVMACISNTALCISEEIVKVSYRKDNLVVHLVQHDILDIPVDAIINPANPSLRHMGGLCGIIHNAAGPELEIECLKFPVILGDTLCKTGDAVITSGYKLKKAKYVIHAVGPDYRIEQFRHEAPEKLKNAYMNSLIVAVKKGLGSIAFPVISGDIFGYPIEEAVRIAVDSVDSLDMLKANKINEIYFAVTTKEHFGIYKKYLEIKYTNLNIKN